MNRLLFNLTLVALWLRRILCWFGTHRWTKWGNVEICPDCGRWRETLEE